jgi:proteasome beta subunit
MYGVLEDGYKTGMTQKAALSLAVRALSASSQRDSASGNGMDLAVINNKDGFRQLSESEVSALVDSLK